MLKATSRTQGNKMPVTRATRSHPEMVRDMSRVTLNFDLSKIPFVHFYPGSRPILTPKSKHVHLLVLNLRAVTDANDDDDDDAGRHSSTTGRHIANKLSTASMLIVASICCSRLAASTNCRCGRVYIQRTAVAWLTLPGGGELKVQ